MKPLRTSNPGSEIQHFYARILDRAAKSIFLLIIFSFLLYIFGILSPYVSLARLPDYWSRPVKEYLQMAEISPGWDWLSYLHFGDFLTFLPIAMLAGVTIVGYLFLVAKFFRHRDHIMGWIAILEIIVLIIAASGIVKVGGH